MASSVDVSASTLDVSLSETKHDVDGKKVAFDSDEKLGQREAGKKSTLSLRGLLGERII